LIGRNGINGTIKFDIPNDADRSFLFDFEIYERVSDSELRDVEKRAVVQGNAGADSGSSRGRHGVIFSTYRQRVILTRFFSEFVSYKRIE
jgi:hypothetical protein